MSPSARHSETAFEDLAAVILAGGRSSRMGRSKPWLDFGGRSLLERVVDRVRPWAREIVIVAAPGQALPVLGDHPEAGKAGPPLTTVYDDRPGEGPLPALAIGLAAITTASWALALGCDAPLLRASVLARLADERDGVDAVIPLWEDRPQPLVALYRRTLAPALNALIAGGERRLHAIAALPRVCLVPSEELRALDPAGDEYAPALAAWRTASGHS